MNSENIIVWGAFGTDSFDMGTNSVTKLKCFLEANNKYNLLFWVDNAKRKWGKELLGKRIFSPEKIKDFPNVTIVINSLSFVDIREQIMVMGGQNPIKVIPFYWYSGMLHDPYDMKTAKEHWLKFGNQIMELFDMSDPETKNQLTLIGKMRTLGVDRFYDFEEYNGTGKKLNYFCDINLAPKGNVTFVDVGAFRGETIEPVRNLYQKRLKRVLAFEPEEDNRSALVDYVNSKEGLKMITTVYPYALGDEKKMVRFNSDRNASAVSDQGDKIVECVQFDEIENKNIVGDTMIKMDIEGAEMEALRGMKDFIMNNHPYLAICLYHRITDLYDVPCILKSIYPGYRLFLRAGYHLECWAVPEHHFGVLH